MSAVSETSKCPLCMGETKRSLLIDEYQLRDCVECSHRFVRIEEGEEHVRAVYDDSYFFDGGAGYKDYTLESEMLIKRGEYYAGILESHQVEPGRVLDIGAAAGFLLQGFLNKGWTGVGLEPNQRMAQYGREELGLIVHEGSVETFESDETFDLVSMIQVAGHFYDPKRAFEMAHEVLSDGGHLLIETWNCQSILARLFGTRWHEYSPPTVVNWFCKQNLNRFVESLGFETVTSASPSKKITGQHIQSLLKYKIGNSPLLKLIPAKIDFPYPSEDLFYSLFRKLP